MTFHALAGLVLFNLALAAVGSAILFGLRPAVEARDLVRLVGLSYLLGVAATMISFTVVVVLGIPLGWTSMTVCLFLLAAGGILLGRTRSRPTQSAAPLSLTLPSAAVLALAVVLLEAVFRKGRLQGLLEFDSWDSWGPKAKGLYYFGHLRPGFLADLPGGSYPPGLPALLSGALHAIGSADMVTLHLQYWFLGLGFVATIAGLLITRVEPLVLFPFVLLVFVMPDIRSRSVDMYGDLPLGFAIAAAALLLALWLEDRLDWEVAAGALLCAGAVLTKREGPVLIVCLVAATFVASLDRLKEIWLRLAAILVASGAAWLTWQIWLSAHHLKGNGPSTGLHFLSDLGRGWDSLHAVVTNLFQFDLLLISMTVAIAATGLCLLVKAWRLALYVGSLLVFLIIGCTVILWSDPNLQLTDVNVVSRLVGTVALSAVALTPLSLQRAWGGAPRRRSVPNWHRGLAWLAVVAAAIAYPATLLAGSGARFPAASDCTHTVSQVAPHIVVFGHAGSYPEADALRTRALELVGTVDIAQDGCGRLRVYTPSANEVLLERARAEGLRPMLEAPP